MIQSKTSALFFLSCIMYLKENEHFSVMNTHNFYNGEKCWFFNGRLALVGFPGRWLVCPLQCVGNKMPTLLLCFSSSCQHHFGGIRIGPRALRLVLFSAHFCGNRPGILCCQLHQSGGFVAFQVDHATVTHSQLVVLSL